MRRVLTLLAVIGVVGVLTGSQPVAAFADDGAAAPSSGLVMTSGAGLASLLPSESRPADWGTGCGCAAPAASGWGPSAGASWGNPFWPWWAGMPIWQISALTGGTWPWYGGWGGGLPGWGGSMWGGGMLPPPVSPGWMGGMAGAMGSMPGPMDGSSGY
jgi:hypothetical protein